MGLPSPLFMEHDVSNRDETRTKSRDAEEFKENPSVLGPAESRMSRYRIVKLFVE
jgi:hypothetical protein